MSANRSAARSSGTPTVENRRARHEYHILETVEAGIVLTGPEVKSLRSGGASLAEAYARVRDGEVWLVGMHIAPYDHGGYADHEPRRPRKLLLHKEEILRLQGRVQEKGLTLVPLRLYFKRGRAKVELGLARGKQLWDKRRAIAEREALRETARAVGRR
jgi:SsrA-binding protein